MEDPTKTINLIARQATSSSLDAFVSLLANPFAQTVERNAFWSALATSLGGSILIAALFCLFRPYNSVVYAPRSRHADEKHAPPPVGKGVFDWLQPLIKTKEQQLVDKIGLDATLFLRFTRMCRNIFTCIAVCGCIIEIPLNMIVHRSSDDGSHDPSNFFTRLTSQGVQGDYLWGYVLLAWLSNIIICFFLWRNYRAVLRLRRAYFDSPEYQKSLHSRTLLITEIPRGLRTDEGLVQVVTEAKDTGNNPRTAIARNVKDLPDLIEEHNETVRGLESVLAKYLANPNKLPAKRPTCTVHKADPSYRKGQKVDAIEYLTARIKELEHQIKEVRETVDKRNAMSYGFASYESIADAHSVAFKTRKKGPQKTHIRLAPRPHDLLWKNLPMSSKERNWNTFVNNIWVTVLTIIWIAPNALIAIFVSNLSNLALVWPAFQTNFNAHTTGWAIVQGVAAPALTSLFYYFLPTIFRRLSARAGDLSKTSRERHVMHKLYTFFIFNNLFLFSLFAAIWGYVAAVIGNNKEGEDVWSSIKDGQLLQKGIRALNQVSTYWITWLLQRNLGAAVDLAQFVNLAWGSFSRHFLHPTPREMIELSAPPPFDYAGYYNYFLFYSTVALCFAYIQPLVLPVCAFYFWIDSYLKKYLLLYVFITKTESGGQFWKVLFNRFIFLTIMSNVLAGLVCIGNTDFGLAWLPQVCSIAPLILLMLAFKVYCAKAFDDKLTFYTTSLVAADVENPAELKALRSDRVGVRFGHPVLYKPLITPMVSAKSKHLLPSIYSGRTSDADIPMAGYSDVYMDRMSSNEPGKSVKGSMPAPFEFVAEGQMDFEHYKNRPEFRDQAGGDGELYGRPADLVRRGSHGTLMTMDGTVMSGAQSRRGSVDSSIRNGEEGGTTYPRGYHQALRDNSPASSVRSMDIGNNSRLDSQGNLLSRAAQMGMSPRMSPVLAPTPGGYGALRNIPTPDIDSEDTSYDYFRRGRGLQ